MARACARPAPDSRVHGPRGRSSIQSSSSNRILHHSSHGVRRPRRYTPPLRYACACGDHRAIQFSVLLRNKVKCVRHIATSINQLRLPRWSRPTDGLTRSRRQCSQIGSGARCAARHASILSLARAAPPRVDFGRSSGGGGGGGIVCPTTTNCLSWFVMWFVHTCISL